MRKTGLMRDDLIIMTSFPNFRQPSFNMDDYNQSFEKRNVIIHASSKHVEYGEHWGPLSIKCAIKGAEHYECNGRFYNVDADSYLIFNDGQYYSSYIYSDSETESFSVNFSAAFLLRASKEFPDDLGDGKENESFEFIEKLYAHDQIVTPLLKRLYEASVVTTPDTEFIDETYHVLLESLLLQQAQLKDEIKRIKARKYSTQVELYKRLNYAKDFIHSCYMNEITLDKLASVACLNSVYFLREFKKYFAVTPHQYVMQRRLEAAKKLLETTTFNIAEICYAVGYRDVPSFNKLFRKNFLVTPGAYRSSYAKKSFSTLVLPQMDAFIETNNLHPDN